MTTIALNLRRDGALLITDTAVSGDDADGQRITAGQTGKVFILPHLAGALAGRGPQAVVMKFFWTVMNTPTTNGIDDIAEHGRRALTAIWTEYRGIMDRADLTPDQLEAAAQSEIVTVGYSEAAGIYRGFSFMSADGFTPHAIPYGTALAPAFGITSLPAEIDVAGLVGLAREQIRRARATGSKQALGFGGQLILTAMKDRDIQIRRVARADDRPPQAVPVPAVAGMNRADRRRMARELRKHRGAEV